MRHFLITFHLKSVASICNIHFSCVGFPTKTYITKLVNEMSNRNDEVVILNIFEFKDEIDYFNFQGIVKNGNDYKIFERAV